MDIESFISAWIHSFQFRITLRISVRHRVKRTAPFIHHIDLTGIKRYRKKNHTVRLLKWSHRMGTGTKKKKNIGAELYALTYFRFLWIKWAQNRNIYYHFSVKKWFFFCSFSMCTNIFSLSLTLFLVYCLFQYSFFYGIRFYFIHFTFDQKSDTHIYIAMLISCGMVEQWVLLLIKALAGEKNMEKLSFTQIMLFKMRWKAGANIKQGRLSCMHIR